MALCFIHFLLVLDSVPIQVVITVACDRDLVHLSQVRVPFCGKFGLTTLRLWLPLLPSLVWFIPTAPVMLGVFGPVRVVIALVVVCLSHWALWVLLCPGIVISIIAIIWDTWLLRCPGIIIAITLDRLRWWALLRPRVIIPVQLILRDYWVLCPSRTIITISLTPGCW